MTDEQAYCVAGKHHYTRERKRGRKSANCPEHRVLAIPSVSERKRELVLAAILEQPDSECRCDIQPDMTLEDLRAMGAGCRDPQYICPRLDACRRALAQ